MSLLSSTIYQIIPLFLFSTHERKKVEKVLELYGASGLLSEKNWRMECKRLATPVIDARGCET